MEEPFDNNKYNSLALWHTYRNFLQTGVGL